MAVDVCRRREIAVSQPFLYVLQLYSVGKEQACAAVSEIMEPDPSKTMLFQKPRELSAQVIGLNKIS